MASNKTIEVVCGIVYKDDKILITRRKKGKSLEGFWEFPGGKIESNEERETALKRELFEELGLVIEIKNFLAEETYHYDSFSINLIAFHCIALSEILKLEDHDKYEFIIPEDLTKYTLAPADNYLVPLILNDFIRGA
jgi:8-oxo-dGTP diphosphatase